MCAQLCCWKISKLTQSKKTLNCWNWYLCAVHNECFNNADDNDIEVDTCTNRPKQWNLQLDLFYGDEQHEIFLMMVWKFLHLFFSTIIGLLL